MVWLDKLIRGLFALIDGVFGWAIGELYTLIILIANVNVFGDYIYEFMGRIYTFLGIFMLFKLSISVVNYILNPDQLTDKTKGFGKIIQQVIIVMGLIIMTPQIFSWAYDLQALILNNNVIYTLVTGTKNDSDYSLNSNSVNNAEESVENMKKTAEETGAMVKYHLLSGFIYREDDSGNVVSAEKENGTKCSNLTKVSGYQKAFDCLVDGDTYNNTKSSEGQYGAKNKFVNEYKVIVSSICLGFAAYVFLVTAFDVALRAVKLGFLQLIAPVPIISMLDPNSAKSGMFSKWFKECKNNYLSLFTRLLVVYFAIEMIKQIFSNSMTWGNTGVTVKFGFVKIFIVLGLLMFVKQLPKFIEDALGIKTDVGGLSLKKKLDSIPIAGKQIEKAGRFAGRSAASLGKMGGRYLGRAVAGADNLTGGHGKKKINKTKETLDKGRNKYRGFVGKHPGVQDLNNTIAGIGLDAQQTAGFDPMKKLNEKRKKIEDVQKQASAIMSRAASEMIKYKDLKIELTDSAGHVTGEMTMEEFQIRKQELEMLKQKDTSTMSEAERRSHAEEIVKKTNEYAGYEKAFANDYVDAVINNRTVTKNDGSSVSGLGNEDQQTKNYITGLQNTVSRSSVAEIRDTPVNGGKAIKSASDKMNNELTKIDSEIHDRQELVRQQKEKKQ